MSAHQLIKAAERMTPADVDAVLLLLAVNTGVDPGASKAVINALVRAAGGGRVRQAQPVGDFGPAPEPGLVTLSPRQINATESTREER
ncbi:MAG TPA: hypothetical protein DCQ33_04055 [Nitrospira sp.]|nr:hypothetical protein [Nitrospira sp.]